MSHTVPSQHSARRPADLSQLPAILAFYRNLPLHWVKILAASGASPCAKHAIALLTDSNAMPGEKDWAERYLCGMTVEPLAVFQCGRPAQS